MKEENRNIGNKRFWQMIRGMCILAVVFIHCKNIEGNEYSHFTIIMYYIIRNIVNFPVAVFFFLSGYFLHIEGNVTGFYKKRLGKLLMPYFFYSFIYIILSMLLGEYVGGAVIAKKLLLGGAATPFYYIIVLAYFTLLAPIIYKYSKTGNKRVFFCFLISPVILSLAYFFLLSGHNVWNYLKLSPYWFSFYFLGIWSGKRSLSIKRFYLWIMLFVSFSLQILSTIVLKQISGFNAFTQMRFGGMLYALVIILLALAYKDYEPNNVIARLVARIGDNSYGIFFLHCGYLMLLDELFLYFRFQIYLPLYWIIEMLFSVVASMITVDILKRIIKSKRLKMLFGVGL